MELPTDILVAIGAILIVFGRGGYEIGYRIALRRNRRALVQGEKYSDIVDEALRQCATSQRVELTVEAKLAPQPEMRGRASLGVFEGTSNDRKGGKA